MRYVVGFMVVLALPLGVSAQDAEEGDSWLERWHPEAVEDPDERSPEQAPEEPALQLKLDDAGVGVTPPPARTPDGYTLEQMDRLWEEAKAQE